MASSELARPDAEALRGLSDAPERAGKLVYRGKVFAPDLGVVFEYERRVRNTGDDYVSTHVSRDAAGEPVLSQAALHNARYELARFDEVHSQTGMVGSVVVSPQGRVRFEVRGPKRTVTREESVDAPVVVGPTLFGFALAHWDALAAGDTIAVRFAALDRARTFAFALRRVEADAETVQIEFAAKSALLRALAPPMRLVFDAHTRKIVRYEGRVPPLLPHGGGLRPLDARVEYTFVAAQYR